MRRWMQCGTFCFGPCERGYRRWVEAFRAVRAAKNHVRLRIDSGRSRNETDMDDCELVLAFRLECWRAGQRGRRTGVQGGRGEVSAGDAFAGNDGKDGGCYG